MLNEVLAGRFRITELLGSGGMGQVWSAQDERMRRDVAVKIVAPQYGMDEAETQGRFQREVQLAGRLAHQNIVTVHDWGEVLIDDRRRTLYLVMELVRGISLHKRLREPTPWPLAVGWATQIAQALDAAHRQGVVHRDIKPANVLLTPEGIVKVLDFGVAKFMGDTLTARELTVTGAPLGSPKYMSPEQAEGAKEIDHRSDLYSLGCLLYHAVTGRPPFTSDVQWAVLRMQMEDTPAPPSSRVEGLPPALNDLILSLLAKRPEDRPTDAASVHDALSTVLIDQAVMVPGEDVLGIAQLGHAGTVSGRILGKTREAAGDLMRELMVESAARRSRLDEELAGRRKAVGVQIDENVAWAEQFLREARAEAKRIVAEAREEARGLVAEETERIWAGAQGEAIQTIDEMTVREVLARFDPHPSDPFNLVQQGYDRKQVDEHILRLEALRDMTLRHLSLLERRFVTEELNSKTTAHSAPEERAAVRGNALKQIAVAYELATQSRLAELPDWMWSQDGFGKFELVRRGYERGQVELRIYELMTEHDSVKDRIAVLEQLLVPQPQKPPQP